MSCFWFILTGDEDIKFFYYSVLCNLGIAFYRKNNSIRVSNTGINFYYAYPYNTGICFYRLLHYAHIDNTICIFNDVFLDLGFLLNDYYNRNQRLHWSSSRICRKCNIYLHLLKMRLSIRSNIMFFLTFYQFK